MEFDSFLWWLYIFLWQWLCLFVVVGGDAVLAAAVVVLMVRLRR